MWTTFSGCNVFSEPNNGNAYVNVPCIVNGTSTTIPHRTFLGQPIYNTSSNTVNVSCELQQGAVYKGNDFKITYNFKANYSYKITVIAKRTKAQASDNDPYFYGILTNDNSVFNNQCNGMGQIPDPAPGSPENVKNINIFSSDLNDLVASTRLLNYSPLSNAYSYIKIRAQVQGATVTSPQTISIKSIKIDEIAPLPPVAVFTLSPSTLTYQSGSITPQTFTVNNTTNTTGVSSYTWNLGSANNGWLYNNLPAPQTIVTTANTISLTPICDKVQANITATVSANGNSYATNISLVSVTAPRIVGGNNLCSNSQPYFVLDLPCNASVSSWSTSNTAIATISSTGVLTKVGDGLITITANLTSSSSGTLCGATTLTRQVIVGTPYPNEFQLRLVSGNSQVCIGREERYEIACDNPWLAQNQLINYSWQWPSGWYLLSQGRTSTGYQITLIPNGNVNTPANMILRVSTGCGPLPPTIVYARVIQYKTNCNNFPRFTISPNPANSEITISAIENEDNKTASKEIKEIKISDNTGTLKSTKKFILKNKREKLFVNNLPIGQYQVSVLTDDGWETIPLTILK